MKQLFDLNKLRQLKIVHRVRETYVLQLEKTLTLIDAAFWHVFFRRNIIYYIS